MKILVLFIFIFSTNTFAQFVKVKGINFELEGSPYTYMGTNFWYGMNLGAKKSGDRARLIRELDHLEQLGVKNLRVMAGSEGPDSEPYRMTPVMQISPGKYNSDIVEGLDFLLAEMGKRKMKAIMCLTNFWNWSGGMSQYVAWSKGDQSIPYPPPHPGGSWSKYQTYTANFYQDKKAIKMFEDHIRYIVNRINTVTNIKYKNDPTIMAWELANEPRGDLKVKSFRTWIHETAKLIKSLDQNHLVTTGSEGDTPFPTAGTSLSHDHDSEYIDYATIHIWVQNWMIYNPQSPTTLNRANNFAINYIEKHIKKSLKLKKPVVLEEFGISRDQNSHDPVSKTTIRDQFYSHIFDYVSKEARNLASPLKGVNFWAWGGEGRPNNIHGLWMPGDDFIGDPPHEYQGWYSVYDKDQSTLDIIKKYADKINQ